MIIVSKLGPHFVLTDIFPHPYMPFLPSTAFLKACGPKSVESAKEGEKGGKVTRTRTQNG